jgi:hypothetical protein
LTSEGIQDYGLKSKQQAGKLSSLNSGLWGMDYGLKSKGVQAGRLANWQVG